MWNGTLANLHENQKFIIELISFLTWKYSISIWQDIYTG